MTLLAPPLALACTDYRQYLRAILVPAMAELEADIESRQVGLHRVFGANLFVAHAVDYIQAIRKADGIDEGRGGFVRQFDRLFSVEGTRLSNRKFELIDAINNALKHIRLDPKRYPALEQHYGPISFQSLFEENGRVLCILDGYRFDYARVVLQPAYKALTSWDFETVEDVLEFARDNTPISHWSADDELMASDDPADAIDQMIIACNPSCEHCGEADACCCAEFTYEGEQGRFEPLLRTDFDFDSVMAKISGAYSPRT
ncbi:hypothetical protein D5038_05415 [Verminephrobacter aporrectodeae subsp. tuberculatae]|uniref:hypothetical protein n=1 Tax=Verminephrobacter aporrectodeae TaxID=1110389 RepID=UPI0022386D06|nr:hypothetical protein [Verminephrobacter aporrectodeae]MCW5255810.1 hypothetical protein [Verminephrobacter aporrectodeae subsp. tuberculatae]